MMNLGEQLREEVREETHEEDGLNYVWAAMQDGDFMPQILKVMKQLRFSNEQAEDLIARVRAEQATASA